MSFLSKLFKRDVTIDFTATPASIQAGDIVTLRWQVKGGGRQVYLSTVRGSSRGLRQDFYPLTGSATALPRQTTYYRIEVYGEQGGRSSHVVAETTIKVEVGPPAANTLPAQRPELEEPIALFTATPTTINRGETVRLRWEVRGHGVGQVDINVIGSGDPEGLSSLSYRPFGTLFCAPRRTTIYKLTVYGIGNYGDAPLTSNLITEEVVTVTVRRHNTQEIPHTQEIPRVSLRSKWNAHKQGHR